MLAAHAAVNLRQIPRLRSAPAPQVSERVSILIPARNEAHRIGPVIESALLQQGTPDLEIIVLDDGSCDGTAEVVRRIAGDDPRVRIVEEPDAPPPSGWLGKPWACHRLSELATGEILVFIDADVLLEPWAVNSAVTFLRESALELVSPYPRQVAQTVAERITQPLVNWSWITTLPMSLARTRSAAFCAAIGQFLVVDAQAYRTSGGHEPVRGFVVEDVEVLRSMKRAGYSGIPVIGGEIASCRMYDGAREVYEGYSKSLWSVFGSLPGAVGGISAMALIYVIPPMIAVSSRDRVARRWGALGYAAGTAGRVLTASATDERIIPDSLAQPISIGAFAAMTTASLIRRRWGTLSWKGREVD
ncbi:MAG: hypothetical protein RL205_1626 [Actinomycetota bacterium]